YCSCWAPALSGRRLQLLRVADGMTSRVLYVGCGRWLVGRRRRPPGFGPGRCASFPAIERSRAALFIEACVQDADGLSEVFGLEGQGTHRLAKIVYQRGVLLRHAVHLANSLVYLLQACRLLDGCRRNLAHDVCNATYRIDDFLHGGTGPCSLFRTDRAPLRRFVDKAFDLFGRLGAFEGQVTYFAGDDGKTLAGFAGSRGLDRSIERQDVGLECNALDKCHDV